MIEMIMKKILITGGSGFIGSYLIDVLLKTANYEILNLDIAEPVEELHKKHWKGVDLLNEKAVLECFRNFNPAFVVHLAARTDTNPRNILADYKVNIEGTGNILSAIKLSAAVERVIITSTQFVNQYSGIPKHDQDFAPHTIYGESKVVTEKLTRAANLDCCWTIIRPTNIWGPRHPRYEKEFWYELKKGRYFHPGRQRVIRSYGYVGNVTDQIVRLLEIERAKIDGEVFYVGDEPINLYDWANGFSIALTRKNVHVVPRGVVKALALGGDALASLKIRFPITTSRYKSMTSSNSAPMKKTFDALGAPRLTLQEGINETVAWLKNKNSFWR
jgi:nucleoside-diphosphate-sugar epimerase